MEDKDREVYAHVIDALMAVQATLVALRGPIELLNGTATNLTQLALRLERKLEDVPAE